LRPGDTVVHSLSSAPEDRHHPASSLGDTLVVTHGPGQFTGEATCSWPPLIDARVVSEPGEVIELSREQVLGLVQTDPEVSDVLMAGVHLSPHGAHRDGRRRCDADRVGAFGRHAASPEFLARNGHPINTWIWIERPTSSIARSIQHSGCRCSRADLPGDVWCCEIRTNQQIADCLGFNDNIDPAQVRDLIVVGAGPAGLRLPSTARRKAWTCWFSKPARQAVRAGSSSRIENYLGFPTGVSGQELTARATALMVSRTLPGCSSSTRASRNHDLRTELLRLCDRPGRQFLSGNPGRESR